MDSSLLRTMSLCKRAGRLILGFDMVKQAVMDGRAQLVVTASDLSDKTLKEIGRICEEWEAPVRQVPSTMDQLWMELNKRVGVAAIADQGFADKLEKLLDFDGGPGQRPGDSAPMDER